MHRIAINGFGRIGRNTFKAGFDKPGFEVVAVNDLTDAKTLAHLLKHDSTYHAWDKKVSHDEKNLFVEGKKIPVLAEKDPTKLPWGKMKVDVVLECTGRFTSEEGAGQHLTAGAKRVIISAPAKGGNVPTHVIGVNEKGVGKSKIINNASCTTNCIAPVAAIMHAAFGVKKAMMTTIHSYTADQVLQDGPHKDLRRARSAAQNIIPTTTGAAIATAEVIPALKGLFDGISIRVPTSCVSLSDFTFLLNKKTTKDEVNKVLKVASKNAIYKGILEVTEEELVSSDFIGNPASAIVDLPFTQVVDGDMVKVLVWYDNELGYSHRLAEIAIKVGQSL
ncbi:MAG TPA: type I glyceraldehyde-3-phosphate dehydrogenase [Candidatus Methylomirabilis sp.]|nr:type I glyceraldehyde-3-phosphate dehydrogenase [Candidatus Methylomirabilis sp.]